MQVNHTHQPTHPPTSLRTQRKPLGETIAGVSWGNLVFDLRLGLHTHLRQPEQTLGETIARMLWGESRPYGGNLVHDGTCFCQVAPQTASEQSIARTAEKPTRSSEFNVKSFKKLAALVLIHPQPVCEMVVLLKGQLHVKRRD